MSHLRGHLAAVEADGGALGLLQVPAPAMPTRFLGIRQGLHSMAI